EPIQPDDPALPTFMLWTSRIYRFPDDSAAAAWFDAQRAMPKAEPDDRDVQVNDLTVIEGVPTFGDESFAVSYTVVESDGYTFWVRSIRLRVGAVTVDVSLGANADDLPLAAVEAMTEHQVECLGEQGCPDPVPVADALASPIVGPNADSSFGP